MGRVTRASRIPIGSPLPDGGFSGGSREGGEIPPWGKGRGGGASPGDGFQSGRRVTGAGVWKPVKQTCPSDEGWLGGEFPHGRGDG